MKKEFFKIIIVNIILILLLLFTVEIGLMAKLTLRDISFRKSEESLAVTFFRELKSNLYRQYIFKFTDRFYNIDTFRENKIEDENKPAVLFIGCSFTYGLRLNYEDIVSTKYAELTKQTTYNLGISGGGPQEFLYVLRNKEIYKKRDINTNNIQYVIYIYIDDHQRRIFSHIKQLAPKYKEKDGILEEQKTNDFFERLKLRSRINNVYYNFIISKYFPKYSWEKEVLYIKEMNREVKKTFTNNGKETKFIVFDYEEKGNENWNDIEKENIQVIKLKDLADFNPHAVPYIISKTDDHPSVLAWNIIVPKLIEKIELQNK